MLIFADVMNKAFSTNILGASPVQWRDFVEEHKLRAHVFAGLNRTVPGHLIDDVGMCAVGGGFPDPYVSNFLEKFQCPLGAICCSRILFLVM